MMIKKYINATIKLVIGCALIGASWIYLGSHPAEKSSLLSGVDVIQHKIHMQIALWKGQNTDHIDKKYKLTRYMNEMKYTAQHTSGCEGLTQKIDKTIEVVQEQTPLDISIKHASYRNTIREWAQKIQNNCQLLEG